MRSRAAIKGGEGGPGGEEGFGIEPGLERLDYGKGWVLCLQSPCEGSWFLVSLVNGVLFC